MSDATFGCRSFRKQSKGRIQPRARGYWRTVGRRLSWDHVTLFFALVIAAIALAAIFAPLVAPFDPNVTSMIHRLKPDRLPRATCSAPTSLAATCSRD